jgi:hypothetical protein
MGRKRQLPAAHSIELNRFEAEPSPVPLTFSQRPDESLGPHLTVVPDTFSVSMITLTIRAKRYLVHLGCRDGGEEGR